MSYRYPTDPFTAIADPTRRQIVALLADRDRTVNEIAGTFDISRPAVSKHLRVLRRAGLVDQVKRGRTHVQHFNADALRPVAEWINHYGQFWDERLATLKAMIEEDNGEKP